MRARSWVPGLVVASLAPASACHDDRPDPVVVAATTGASHDALSYVGIERVIPLRFIMIPDGSGQDPATFDAMQGAVQNANQAFRGAGAQFTIRSVEKWALASLQPPNGSTPVTWGNIATPGTVANELAQVFPGFAGLAGHPAPMTQRTAGAFLFYAAARGAATQDLVVWVTWDGNAFGGANPWDGRAIMGPGSGLGDRWKFVHELGHVMGLGHAAGLSSSDSLVCMPSAALDCDGSTQGMTTLADHWDMVYLPGTSPQNPHTTFSNRAAAAAAGAANLRWIDDGLSDGTGNRCAVTWTTPGYMTCDLPGQAGTGYSETWTASPSGGGGPLRGYMWPTAEYRYGTTVMPYRFIPPSSAPDWPAGFSDSETDLIRRNLRWDTKVATPGSLLLPSGATGGRPLLGRALRRRPADKLDFDGDGKRDIAVWEPPTTAGGTGLFRVFTSASNFTAQLTMAFGALGDTPVPADYNGDGVTDFAVVHDSGTISNSATMFWRACTSTLGTPATHSCASPSNIQWGDRADVPLPGTRFNPAASAELTVYRPSDGNVYVINPNTWAQTTISLATGAERDQTPFVGDFDLAPGNDLALYNPREGFFRMKLSGNGWSTPTVRTFCPSGPANCAFVAKGTGTAAERAAAVPVWGLQAANGFPTVVSPLGALGLWDPSNGTWSVMWNPVNSGAIESHQWGVSGDVVVADGVGIGAPVSSGQRSHLVVYRSDSTAGPGTLYRCSFPAGAGTCPGGSASQSISVPGGQRRTEAFAVADMVGDGKPELCAYAPDTMSVRCFTSDSGYTAWKLVAFPSPAAQLL